MKSLKTYVYAVAILFLAVLFSQCESKHHEKVGDIPYNKDSAQVHYISLTDAAQLTADYRAGKSELVRQLKDTSYMDKNFSLPIAEKFNRDIFALLLNQDGAKGIRIYMGKDKMGKVRVILYAVDAQGNDILADGGEAAQYCPPNCSPKGSPLMTK